MTSVLNYILELTLGLAICYVVYLLFLRNETRFQFVRIYLVGSLLLCCLFPLISLSGIRVGEISLSPEVSLDEIVVNSLGNTSPMPGEIVGEICWWIYGVGLLLVTTKLLYQLYRLRLLKYESVRKKYNDADLYLMQRDLGTFTFQNAIFFNAESLNEDDQKQVLAHEYVHVRLKHGIDLIILEMVKTIFWFHPMVHLYSNALKLVHEYQADQGVIAYLDSGKYINLLVNQTLSNVGLSLGNHFGSPSNNPIGFYKSITLKRIKMMKKKTNEMNPIRYIIPVLAIAVVFAIVSCDGTELPTQNPVETESKVYTEGFDVAPSFNGGFENLSAALGSSIKYPVMAMENKVEAKTYVSFVIDKTGNIKDVSCIKTKILTALDDETKATYTRKFETEAARVISNMSGWKPGEIAGQPVNAKMVLPISFKL